ncbi:tetratricopeptide repeat protein [Moorena sp. SIO3H5]|uniref:tetratricopeptide repeat protein n=1 Tax=Moorena sp. SIO3H5 TaxID=2607834 RepID=UPI0013BAAF21|nr:tetratricopeptide repeat protein [Moorena sp. SIO3H5]NEO71828.1 tetratricopeptide repeat protein [Moorena sp. SIO3H5]
MASKKKTGLSKRSGFGIKSLMPELRKAEALIIKQKWEKAQVVLENLSDNYPHNADVLSHLVNVCYELKDLPAYERACEMLVKVDPKNADAAYGLAGGHYANLHPILALEAFQNAVSRFPNHEKADDAREAIADLDSKVDELLAEMNLTRSNGWEIAVLNERAQAYFIQGKYKQAKLANEELLRLRPDFVFSYNNLSLISFTLGDNDKAIAYCQKVLEIQPDNIHALGNLTRYHILNGDMEQAESTCERLINSQAKGWDVWTKKVEALSYFGDDQGILQVFEQAKASGEFSGTSFSGLFSHLVAVALTRQGRIDEARKLWLKTPEGTEGSKLAQANLQDLKKPIGERHAPWAFPLTCWLTQKTIKDLSALADSHSKKKGQQLLAKTTEDYFDSHPQITNIIPILLERGDPQGREFAFRFASLAKTPEMLVALRDFAISQHGPDAMRYEAAITVSEAKLLPQEGVKIWFQGELQEVNLISYELHDEPTVANHSRKVKNLGGKAISLMEKGGVEKAVEAEKILQKALEIEPDSPDLLNNLAGTYQMQGRTEEAYNLLSELSSNYPDYLFPIISLARLKIKKGEIPEAEALLKPLISRKRFQFSEFSNFCTAQIELFMAKKDKDSARKWLQMWENLDPENPDLLPWKLKLDGNNLLNKLKSMVSGW